MKTYIPDNAEVFFLTASDFLAAGEGDWRAERLAEEVTNPEPEDGEDATEYKEERQAEAARLAGWYWWICCPGCLPDSDASGPFESEEEAIQDAGGGEYEDYIIALSEDLGCEPSEIDEESHEYYGLKVLSYGREEYAIGTEEEAEEAWDQALDSYIEECIQPEIDRLELGNLSAYVKFDEEMWKRDARMDGRGHALASYDGDEMELADGYVAFRIN